eukprot:UN24526
MNVPTWKPFVHFLPQSINQQNNNNDSDGEPDDLNINPKELENLIESESGIVLGEYQLQFIKITKHDIISLKKFKQLGGLIHSPVKIPTKLPTRIKKKSADLLFSNIPMVNRRRGLDEASKEAEENLEQRRAVNVIGMTWHPLTNRLAVAIKNHGVFLYNQTEKKWESRSVFHPKMKNMTMIKYNPLGSLLGVASHHGICCWRFRPVLTTYHKNTEPMTY